MKKIFLAFLFISLWSQPLSAEIVENDLPPIKEMFEAPCLEFNIPTPLAMAIARVESGLKPWILNIEGQAFRFDSKEEALKKAEEAWAAGRSFDVGLMQINSWWLRRYDVSLEAALDPVANVYFGAWILKNEIGRHGDLKSAIGAYHSPDPARASRYADVVMAALERGPQEAPERIKTLTATPQDAAQEKGRQISGSSNMLPASSEKDNYQISMMVMSKNKLMATQNSMKLAGSNPQNSMKVKMAQ